MTDSDPSMNLARDDWASVLRLLDEALDLPEPQREPWLAALDADLLRLQPALRKLLDQRRAIETGSFLKGLPALNGAPSVGAGFAVGHRIGPYALLRELGRGGMAGVWLAERADAAHSREVALKLPHLGARVIAERFVRERRILSALTHPHIAGVLDAGAEGAQPWLAMEYVDGCTITDWAAQQQLDIRARLRLFLQVLQAVQHAHALLVIHRDIKPSNVLVATDGQVKLLDFGVAKLLGDDGASHETELTQLGGRAMTPQYASPEQVAGQPLGTASDVYSLGVLLYELLTGRLLYALKRDTPAAVEEAILAAHIIAPSAAVADKTASRALRGDVDTIVTKALAPRPTDRYASAESMAQDIERHLQSLPILAQPAKLGYRLRKGLGRHRVAVGAGTAIAAALLVGIVATVWQARQARHQAATARAQSERADAVADALVALFRETAGTQRTLGNDPAGREIEKLLSAAASSARSQPNSSVAVKQDLLRIVGTLHNDAGLFEEARDLQDERIALLSGSSETDVYDLASAHYEQAATYSNMGKSELREQHLRAAAQALEGRSDLKARRRRAQALSGLARELAGSARLPEAEQQARAAVALLEPDGTALSEYGQAAYSLGFVQLSRSDYAEAAQQFERALVVYRTASPSPHPAEVANVTTQLAAARLYTRELSKAMTGFESALQQYARATGPRSTSAIFVRSRLARTLSLMGHHAQAEQVLDEAMASAASLGDSSRDLYLNIVRTEYVRSMLAAGDLARAGAMLQDSAPYFEVSGKGSTRRAGHYLLKSRWLRARGEMSEALDADDMAEALERKYYGTQSEEVADVWIERARVLSASGSPVRALAALDEATSRLHDSANPFSAAADVRRERIYVSLGTMNPQTALASLRKELELVTAAPPQDRPVEVEARLRGHLARILAGARSDEFRAHIAAALELRREEHSTSPARLELLTLGRRGDASPR
jgi:eukaryotic-like serine/threonine-protein kinase